MKKVGKGILIALVVLFLLAYGGYQAFRYLSPSVETETVYMHTAYETAETTCFAVRSETILQKKTDGYLFYELEDGSRVAKSGEVASIYPDQSAAENHQKIEDIRRKIDTLKRIQKQSDAYHSDLDMIREQVDDALSAVVSLTEVNNAGGAEELADTLTELLNKQQIVTGRVSSFENRIATLESALSDLLRKKNTATGVVNSPCAGYFISRADGYEQILTVKDLAGITAEKIEAAIAAAPDEIPENCIGKIVGDYEWYLVCTVPERYISYLGEGEKRTVRMPFIAETDIPVTVVSCRREADGKLAVVLKCTFMSKELSSARVEHLQIQLVEHTGLRVPKEAICTNDTFETGVYVRVGYTVVFRKVRQEYAEGGSYVICTPTEEDGCLKAYDAVIVKGKNLHDGKILR